MNDFREYIGVDYTPYLMHYGRSVVDGAPGRGSGRYPRGSGANPKASSSNKKKFPKSFERKLNKLVKKKQYNVGSELRARLAEEKARKKRLAIAKKNEQISKEIEALLKDAERKGYSVKTYLKRYSVDRLKDIKVAVAASIEAILLLPESPELFIPLSTATGKAIINRSVKRHGGPIYTLDDAYKVKKKK